MRKVLKGISAGLIALMVLLAMLLVGLRIFGLQIYTVLSGSMEPAYHTGALVYVRKVDPHALEEGDVITFRLNGQTIATHRIIEVVETGDQNAYRTKGDANKTPDGSLVQESQILGSPLFTIPYLGYLAAYIQSPPGMYFALAACGAVIIFVTTVDMTVGDKSKTKKKGEPQDEKEC